MFIFLHRALPGLLITAAVAASAVMMARLPAFAALRVGPLPFAILLGFLLGNLLPRALHDEMDPGVDIAKSSLLRLGIILYGFQITFQQIISVGWSGILINILVVLSTFALAVYLGTRMLGLDRQTSILIGAGNSICGAAAILATEPVLRTRSDGAPIAVATVVVFGTLSMMTYPLLYPLLGLSELRFGIFVGSTVHEVAQVIAAGHAISDDVAATAVIEKLIRVMMLGPLLLLLSYRLQKDEVTTQATRKVIIPWFVVLFVGTSGINSFQLIPAYVLDAVAQANTAILAMAMAALGTKIRIELFRDIAAKPMMLGAILFVHLIVSGYLINHAVFRMFGSDGQGLLN